MTEKRQNSADYILESIEYGRLSRMETERRLNRIIDRELCSPLNRPVNTGLVDLCTALILKMHGVEMPVSDTETRVNQIMKRIRQRENTAKHRRILRPALVAAAALIIALVGSLGLIRFQWFSGYSSEDKEQYIVEGHRIDTGKSAGASTDTNAYRTPFIRTGSAEELAAFLGFDPHYPEEIYHGYLSHTYTGSIGGGSMMADCYYLSSASGIPDGELAFSNFNLSESIYYHITWNPDIADDEYCSPGGDEEGYDMTVEGVRVRCSMVYPNYYCSWRSGNAVTTLLAHKPEIDLMEIAASLIRAQAADPLTNDQIDRIVDEATSEEYIKEIIHQKGSTTYSGTSLKEFIRFTGYNPYMPDTLCGRFTPQNYTAEYTRSRHTMTCDFYSGADAAGDRVTYTKTHFSNSSIQMKELIPSEAQDRTEQLVIRNTNVVKYEYDGMTVWLWSGYATVCRLEAPAELELPDTAVEEILAAYEDQGRSKLLREATEKAAAAQDNNTSLPTDGPAESESAPDASRMITEEMIRNTPEEDELPEEDEVYAVDEEMIRDAMAEREAAGLTSGKRMTREMITAAIEKHAGPPADSLSVSDLAELGEYLGVSVDHLSLDNIGWLVQRTDSFAFSYAIHSGIRYFKASEPEVCVQLGFISYADIAEAWFTVEQDGDGVYRNIEGMKVYCYTNCGHNGCLWIDGLTIYYISSDQPREVLDQIAAQLIRSICE